MSGGGGSGGLAAALSLPPAGIASAVFEQVQQPRELGVGINTLPNAIKELAALGLLPALDRAGIRTRELIYANRLGQVVWRAPRGPEQGVDTPPYFAPPRKLPTPPVGAVRGRLRGGPAPGGCKP